MLVVACGGGGGGGGGGGNKASAPESASVSGTLVDGVGAPVADTLVILDGDPAKLDFTGDSGFFALQAAPGPHQLVVSSGGVVLLEQDIEIETKKKKPVDLELGELLVLDRVFGRAVDPLGEPVVGAEITISGPFNQLVVSDDEGEFSAQLAAGSYTLSPSWQGYDAPDAGLEVSLSGTAPVELTVLTVLKGQLLDALLQPLPGATVFVDTEPQVVDNTDEDGFFRMQVPVGTFPIAVFLEGTKLFEEDVTTSASEVNNLGPRQVLVRVTGRLIDEALAPVADAELVVDTSPITIESSEANGTFALDLPVLDLQMCVRLQGIIVHSEMLMGSKLVGEGITSLGEVVVKIMDDIDGDGLGNGFEAEGWQIFVDELGQGNFELRSVASNPLAIDSDSDGLQDNEELGYGTDPTRSDTDGDLLSDQEEIFVYQSQPGLVDSDRDALPLDANGDPDTTAIPNPAFFDGAEILNLRTSPTLADTDGDGIRDREEVLEGGTSARMADLPSISIEIFGEPVIGFEGDEVLEQSTIQTSVKTDNTSSKKTKEFNFKTEGSLDTMVKVQGKKSWPGGFSASVEAEATLKASVNSDYALHSSSEALSDFEAVLEMESMSATEYTAGKIEAAVEVTNDSDITVRYSDLEILVFQIDPSLGLAGLKPLGKLNPLEGETTGDGVLLGPQGSVTILRENTDLDLLRVRDYMRNPSGLYFRIGDFSLFQLDEQGEAVLDYDIVAQNVTERTGLISIDWGDGTTETHNVATNVERYPDGSPKGLSMAEALELIGYSFETERAGPDIGIDDELIDPMDPDAQSQLPPGVPSKANQLVLTKLEGKANVPVTDAQGEIVTLPGTETPAGAEQYWLVQGPGCVDEGANQIVDFPEIRILPGEGYYLQFVTDLDGDGLTRQQEDVIGTSDLLVDSDADLVSDFDEVVVGWDVSFDPINGCGLSEQQVNVLAYSVRSNPRFADLDGDGLLDGQEREVLAGTHPFPTNPFLKDTDFDGVLDTIDTSSDPCNLADSQPFSGPPRVRLAMAKSTYDEAGLRMLDQSDFGNDGLLRGNAEGIVDNVGAVGIVPKTGLEWTTDVAGANLQAVRFVNEAPFFDANDANWKMNVTFADGVMEILRDDSKENPPRMLAVSNGQGWTWTMRVAAPASNVATAQSSDPNFWLFPVNQELLQGSTRYLASQPGFALLKYTSLSFMTTPNSNGNFIFDLYVTPSEKVTLTSNDIGEMQIYANVTVRVRYETSGVLGEQGTTFLSMFINGTKVAEQTVDGPLENPSVAKQADSQSLWVGSYDYDVNQTPAGNFDEIEQILGVGAWGKAAFAGSMDEFRIYDRPLSDSEIAGL